jgi:hypothetical protein
LIVRSWLRIFGAFFITWAGVQHCADLIAAAVGAIASVRPAGHLTMSISVCDAYEASVASNTTFFA